MSRHLVFLGLIAIPALALTGCGKPSVLAKAKPGECYSVVGRDSVGNTTLAKTPCAGSPAALAAACPTPSAAMAAAPGVACPAGASTVAASKAVAASTYKASSGAVVVKRAARRHVQVVKRTRANSHAAYASRDDDVARSGEVTSRSYDYARVDQELAGGPVYHGGEYERFRGDAERRGEYERHDQYSQGEAYRREEYGRRENYGRLDHAPPPPPPPPPALYARRGATVEYSERSRQSGAYRESYSASGSASSSSYGYGRVECDCDGGARRSAPPSPFDHNGFLTWRGKTPG